jgi:hypothetical protein
MSFVQPCRGSYTRMAHTHTRTHTYTHTPRWRSPVIETFAHATTINIFSGTSSWQAGRLPAPPQLHPSTEYKGVTLAMTARMLCRRAYRPPPPPRTATTENQQTSTKPIYACSAPPGGNGAHGPAGFAVRVPSNPTASARARALMP